MSKRRSATSRPPDPPPVIYLDENLSSPRIGEALRQYPDWHVQLHYDNFQPGMSDVDVIAACAERGWILVSCDDRIRIVPENRAAVIRSAVKAFMFCKGNYHGGDYSSALGIARHRMIKLINRTAGPFFARIHVNGDVRLFEDKPAGEMTALERTARKYGEHVLHKIESV
jgi:hypothetical protein